MFETHIGTKAYEGIKLHKKDGSDYWKLRLTCHRKDCSNEIEMGDCLCFSSEGAMIKARDEHGMHCSAKCWVADTDEDKVTKEILVARKSLMELDPDDRHYYVDDMKDDISVLDGYWQYVAEEGCYDGSEFFEEFDLIDCPI